MNSYKYKLRLMIIAITLIPGLAQAAELKLTAGQLANVRLTTIKVVSREINPRLSLTGALTSDRRKTYRVAPVVEGMVTKLRAVEHERVRKGQVLASLRSNTLGQAQADYLEASARFELALAERSRIEGLWKDGVVAESRWLKANSEYKGAQASLDQRRRLLSLAGLSGKQIEALSKNLDRLAEFELVSPIDGMVMGVDIKSGQLLAAGQTAFHVDDLSTLWVMVKIPVANLSQVDVGAEAVVRVRASPGQSYRGKLESLGGEVEKKSQTLTGRIVLDNKDWRLRPGMYAEVIMSGVTSQGLTAPVSAVFRVGDQTYVFKVLGGGRFEPVAVEIGAESGGWVPVYSGIEAGAEIVSSGVAELKSHWQYQGGE